MKKLVVKFLDGVKIASYVDLVVLIVKDMVNFLVVILLIIKKRQLRPIFVSCHKRRIGLDINVLDGVAQFVSVRGLLINKFIFE